MHEFSIAQTLVKAVIEAYDGLARPGVRLCGVRVVVGNLRQVVPDNLVAAYDALVKDTAAEGSRLDLVPAPASGRCRACGTLAQIRVPFFTCRSCGSVELDVVGGNELYLESLEIEEEDGPANERHTNKGL